MRKLKAKIEFYSLSTIISEKRQAENSLSPNISSIEPKYYPKNKESYYHDRKPEKAMRSWTKNSRSTKIDLTNRFKPL
jgi:hypothetical protein